MGKVHRTREAKDATGGFGARGPAAGGSWRCVASSPCFFGRVVLFWPTLVLAALALLFGLYAEVGEAIAVGLALASSGRGAQRDRCRWPKGRWASLPRW